MKPYFVELRIGAVVMAESVMGAMLAAESESREILRDGELEADEAQMAANARLIAAAPDLLDACRKALYAIKGREHDQFIRDAIAKATGEQS